MRSLLTMMLLAAAMLPALGWAQSTSVEVPLMLAPDAERQGFVRIINESNQAGTVRITAVDDGGTAASPIEIGLAADQSLHLNSDDLERDIGLGQGHWRLAVETALDVLVLAFVRHGDGFLTAMHDVLPRDADGRLVAQTFNPGSNMNQASRLRLANTGAEAESVSIEGVDDQGADAGPVTLTLPAGQSRTLTAFELENGAQGLNGTLGDGAGKWRLFITTGSGVVGMSLLESASGHLTNISTARMLLAPASTEAFQKRMAGKRLLAAGGAYTADFTGARFTERSGSEEWEGSYQYTAIGPRSALVELRYDDGDRCAVSLIFETRESGRLLSVCADGTNLDSGWRLASTEPPTGDYYGAFAHNATDGPGPIWVWGYSTDASTQAEADSLALNSCISRLTAPGDSCSVVLRFGTGRCLVVYVDNQTNRALVGRASTQAGLSAADDAARMSCEDLARRPCRRVVSACNSSTAGAAGISPQTLTPLQVSEKRKH